MYPSGVSVGKVQAGMFPHWECDVRDGRSVGREGGVRLRRAEDPKVVRRVAGER